MKFEKFIEECVHSYTSIQMLFKVLNVYEIFFFNGYLTQFIHFLCYLYSNKILNFNRI